MSCSSTDSERQRASLADSVVLSYLAETKNSLFFDTTDYNYRLLAAYARRDTAFFKREKQQREVSRKIWDYSASRDTCINPITANSFKTEEAYLMMLEKGYSCPVAVEIRLERDTSEYFLRYRRIKKTTDFSSCKILKDETTSITENNWKSFIRLIHHGDFWGVKESSGLRGCGGSTLGIIGFQKNYPGPRYQNVSRYEAEETSFWKVYEYALKLSGAKAPCAEESEFKLTDD